jgi:uncharacterized metal-binding protein YceD (DUF177 family)
VVGNLRKRTHGFAPTLKKFPIFALLFKKQVKKNPNTYIIPFSVLKNGEHSFLFTIEKELFKENNYDDIHDCQVKAHITFNKNTSNIIVNFHIYGTLRLTCDRCGDDFDMEINLDKKLIVKTDSVLHSEDEDMITLSKDESELDMASFIYQYIVLSLPMQRVHPTNKKGKSACNPQVIDKLKRLQVNKSNEENYILNHGKLKIEN